MKYYKVPVHSIEHLQIEFKRAYVLLEKLQKCMDSIDDIMFLESEFEDCPEEPQEDEDEDMCDDRHIINSDQPDPSCLVFHSNDGDIDLEPKKHARSEASV